MKESSYGAVFDETGKYRYRLWRRFDPSRPGLCMIMLNPSTADCSKNDPTIARCVRLADSWGFGGIEVVNLFAFLASKPRELWQAADPVGIHNDLHIRLSLSRCETCVVAWGNLPPSRQDRANQVLKMLVKKKLFCLGLTKMRQPRHPLYLSSEVSLEEYVLNLPPQAIAQETDSRARDGDSCNKGPVFSDICS